MELLVVCEQYGKPTNTFMLSIQAGKVAGAVCLHVPKLLSFQFPVLPARSVHEDQPSLCIP